MAKKEDNLMSPQELNARLTPEQRKKNASKAGKQSAQNRRAIKTFKQAFEEELDEKKIKDLVISMYEKAKKGDTKAFELIRDTMGQKPKENINVSGEVNNPFAGMSTDELRKIIDGN